jgi:hypothetical protein
MPSTSSQALLFEVAVLFREGYGDRFGSAAAALDYAETQMHRLLGEFEDLAAEAFDGIYCSRSDTEEVWRFDYQNATATWIPESGDDSAKSDLLWATILPFRLKT